MQNDLPLCRYVPLDGEFEITANIANIIIHHRCYYYYCIVYVRLRISQARFNGRKPIAWWSHKHGYHCHRACRVNANNHNNINKWKRIHCFLWPLLSHNLFIHIQIFIIIQTYQIWWMPICDNHLVVIWSGNVVLDSI